MCNYLGYRVSKAEYIRLMGIEKDLRNLGIDKPAYNGFDYREWPIIKPMLDGKDFSIEKAHLEYIPPFVNDETELISYRKKYTWLNAKSENLFINEKGRLSIYKEGAETGRCLVLATHFYESRHIPVIGLKGNAVKEVYKIPFLIQLKNADGPMLLAGVSRKWTNHARAQSADTAAIVTTAANEPMKYIHNAKERMPTILPRELAEEWLQPGLSPERIKEIATYQIPGDELEYWPIAKDYLKKENPEEKIEYEELQTGVYDKRKHK